MAVGMWNILYMQRNFIFFFFIFYFYFFDAGLLKKWDIVSKTAWEQCYGCAWVHGHTRPNMKSWNVRQHCKLQVIRFLMNCPEMMALPAESSRWSFITAAKVYGDFFFTVSASQSWLFPNEELGKKKRLRCVFDWQKSLNDCSQMELVQFEKIK